MKLSPSIIERLCCPQCHATLTVQAQTLVCLNNDCNAVYPIHNDVPILINEANSVLRIAEQIAGNDVFYNTYELSPFMRFTKKFLPDIHLNLYSQSNMKKLLKTLLQLHTNPKVLVVGGSQFGDGVEHFAAEPRVELTETDVSWGPRLGLLCDCHDLPFADGTFDCVIIQVVLEHVADPYRCAAEIHRVLKSDGFVYAETPFMQQVHGGRFDFTRFTAIGHRRLFRNFEEVDSGILCGPGMALAWSYQYFLLAFFKNKYLRRIVYGFTRITSFFLKYFDYYLAKKPTAIGAASAMYFWGKRSEHTISDREIITEYWDYIMNRG